MLLKMQFKKCATIVNISKTPRDSLLKVFDVSYLRETLLTVFDVNHQT